MLNGAIVWRQLHKKNDARTNMWVGQKKKMKSLTDKMDAFVFSQVSDQEQKASDLTNNNRPNNGQMLGSADVLGLNISPTFSFVFPGVRWESVPSHRRAPAIQDVKVVLLTLSFSCAAGANLECSKAEGLALMD